MPQKNLVVCYKQAKVDDYLIEQIRSGWPDVNIINVGQSEVGEALLKADYFCGHVKVPVDWDQIVAQGRLRWIQSSAAGMDWCLVPSVIASDIEITTASGALADQVAEHTLALLLAAKRNLYAFFSQQFDKTGCFGKSDCGNFDRKEDFGENKCFLERNSFRGQLHYNSQNSQLENNSQGGECHTPKRKKYPQEKLDNPYRGFKRLPTADLTGSKVGIVGFGGVGRRLAEILTVFKTQIYAVDLFPTNKPGYVFELWPPEKTDELLAVSDVVVLCLPLNDSTRYTFNAARFARMKPGAMFANIARGALVKTDDLIFALNEEHLGGAVVDVTDPEPLPPEHPLWSARNILITPHVAGQAAWRFEAINDLLLENVKRRKNGKPLINRLSTEGKRLGFPLRNGETPLWIE